MLSESRQILESLDIEIPEISLHQPVLRLSGGQRQAIAICRAIYWKAELLIMDEPTAALGVPEQRKVMQLIRRLKEQNIAIIFISHNLNDIFEIGDRIAILRQGRLVGDRMINGINKEEVVSLMVQGKLTVN
jgi:simple sugar transport system ATP-binding protein